jgi:phosphatidylserine/phosphatidylglycerophosphate/cardiolipin synthase-like enzyme
MKKVVVVLFSLVALTTTAWGMDVEVAEAPTDDLSLTVSAIQSAQSSILLNIYELSSPQIADALIAKIQSGVLVQILEEGQPVGGLSTASKGIQTQIAQAMSSERGRGDFLYEMTSQAGGKRRYRWDHAKYAVIDGNSLLIGSENYSPTGNPTPGSLGNRGWEVLVHDSGIAGHFKQVFQTDATLQYNDVLDITSGNDALSSYYARRPSPSVPTTRPVSSPQDSATALSASNVEPITSPDTSQAGLLALINNAHSVLYIEEMTFQPGWGKLAATSPLYDAVVAAARRGVAVRVLLNDETVFDHPNKPSKPQNRVTNANLNQLAQTEHLNLGSRIADIKAMGIDYIHNKGVLVDDNITLISSINWDWNSITNNREAAIAITSSDINAHYAQLFVQDWNNSANTPANGVGPSGNNPGPQIMTPQASIATQAPQITMSCPDSMSVTATLGTIGQSAGMAQVDPGFQSLSGKTISASFIRDYSSSKQGCVLQESNHAGSISNNKFVEVKKNSDGSYFVILEGYTPVDEKLYSVKSRVPASAKLQGTFDANVYDASGPARDVLGIASLSLNSVLSGF